MTRTKTKKEESKDRQKEEEEVKKRGKLFAIMTSICRRRFCNIPLLLCYTVQCYRPKGSSWLVALERFPFFGGRDELLLLGKCQTGSAMTRERERAYS